MNLMIDDIMMMSPIFAIDLPLRDTIETFLVTKCHLWLKSSCIAQFSIESSKKTDNFKKNSLKFNVFLENFPKSSIDHVACDYYFLAKW
jgi:hypothetical protein